MLLFTPCYREYMVLILNCGLATHFADEYDRCFASSKKLARFNLSLGPQDMFVFLTYTSWHYNSARVAEVRGHKTCTTTWQGLKCTKLIYVDRFIYMSCKQSTAKWRPIIRNQEAINILNKHKQTYTQAYPEIFKMIKDPKEFTFNWKIHT